MIETDLIGHMAANATQIAWFLGAGTSRTAGMPTATDLTWDLKRRYYCLHENQNLQLHDIHNKAIKEKIQAYCESKGFPPCNSVGEYSFYFDLTFGTDYAAQQTYLATQLSSSKISLSIGQRILGALIEMGLARVVFSTNFDEVVETAFSLVSGKALAPFTIEGSYAALAALNADRFPIYAKLHGDFRYQSVKNLSADLLKNDRELQKCFLAVTNRFGLVVSGYSGRDQNVMAMFHEALNQGNPFPNGLFWTTTRAADVSSDVEQLITAASEKGINAHLVETGTFDILLSRLWNQIPNKPDPLNLKVRTAVASKVSIPLPQKGRLYPLLRTNALPVVKLPNGCATFVYRDALTVPELNDRQKAASADVIIVKPGNFMFWGAIAELHRVLDPAKIEAVKPLAFDDPVSAIRESRLVQSFFERALANACIDKKPLVLRQRNGRVFHAIVQHHERSNALFDPIRQALAYRGNVGPITGNVPGRTNVTWAESASLKFVHQAGKVWLFIQPDVWIFPQGERENSKDFLRSRKLQRYNSTAYALLDAWIKVLLGNVGGGGNADLAFGAGSEYPATFVVNTRTMFSGASNG